MALHKTLSTRDWPCILGDFRKVVIPVLIEIIDCMVFSMRKTIEEIAFEPGSKLKQIGQSAFSESSLKRIFIPKSVEVISIACFCRCRSLRDVKIESPSGLLLIEDRAFADAQISYVTIEALADSPPFASLRAGCQITICVILVACISQTRNICLHSRHPPPLCRFLHGSICYHLPRTRHPSLFPPLSIIPQSSSDIGQSFASTKWTMASYDLFVQWIQGDNPGIAQRLWQFTDWGFTCWLGLELQIGDFGTFGLSMFLRYHDQWQSQTQEIPCSLPWYSGRRLWGSQASTPTSISRRNLQLQTSAPVLSRCILQWYFRRHRKEW
jgi:hypothetical protein